MQNLKKALQRIQNYGDAPFLRPKWSISLKKTFFQNYLYHSHLPFSSFYSAEFKKNSSSKSRVMMGNFRAKNGPFPKMKIFSEFFSKNAAVTHTYTRPLTLS